MNIIVKAVQDAMYIIPEDILKATFLPRVRGYARGAETLEQAIISQVVNSRVVPDANIAKGEHMTIWLGDLKPKIIQDYRVIFEIPANKLLGKTILSVLSVSYAPYTGGIGSLGYAFGGTGPMFAQDTMTATQQMVEASSAIPNVSTAKVEIMGENVLMIEDSQRFTTQYHVQVYVTDSNYLNKIDPRSYEYFSTLVEYAVKAHVYRKLRLTIDRARIEGGSELGVFKDIVDEYADSETNYRTFLREKWAKVAFMDNRPRYSRFLKAQVPIAL